MSSLLEKLSYKFLLIVIGGFLGSVLLFYILFVNRYIVTDFFLEHYTDLRSTTDQVAEMQAKIDKQKMSKKDKTAIRSLMRQYPTLSLQLYSNDREYIADHILSEDGISISTNSVWVELYYPLEEDYRLNFYDGDCYLVVQSYQGMSFMMIYLFVIATISILMFFGVIIHFVRKKMKYVLQLEHEMKLIENGDLTHQIKQVGNDEIGSLAAQLNHLRIALKENMEKEKEARVANEELITTMSHDLRTPLTSLLGYLDILEMKIYKNEEDHDAYIQKCKQKADQIKMMSDRLFTHFFVYAQNDDVILKDISISSIKEVLSNCCQELSGNEFQVEVHMEEVNGTVLGDMGLIERIFDNIFSNIVKYAEKYEVQIACTICENQLCMNFNNHVKASGFREESTGIGLKSMKKMVRQMNGELLTENTNGMFQVKITLPLQNKVTM